MTVNEKILEMMEGSGIPYRAKPDPDIDEYWTFEIDSDKSALAAENSMEEAQCSVSLHWIVPETTDYLETKRNIRKAIIRTDGFYMPAVAMFVEGTEYNRREDAGLVRSRHIVFEFQAENDFDTENL